MTMLAGSLSLAATARRCRCQGAAHAYHGAGAQVRRLRRRHRPLPNGGSGAERRAAMNLVRVNGAGMRGAREAGGNRRAVSAIISPVVAGVGRGCGLVGLGAHDTATRAPMGGRWGHSCWCWGSSALVPSSRRDRTRSCSQRSARPWTCSRGRRASAGPRRGNSSGTLQSTPLPRGDSRSSMTEPMSNVCTPKGMWCLGWR